VHEKKAAWGLAFLRGFLGFGFLLLEVPFEDARGRTGAVSYAFTI
jgi:hypothetical protein